MSQLTKDKKAREIEHKMMISTTLKRYAILSIIGQDGIFKYSHIDAEINEYAATYINPQRVDKCGLKGVSASSNLGFDHWEDTYKPYEGKDSDTTELLRRKYRFEFFMYVAAYLIEKGCHIEDNITKNIIL